MPVEFDESTALIVTDVQNDFGHPGGSLYVQGGERILPPISLLISLAEAAKAPVVYSRNWHPAHTPHFENEGGPWPAHCVAGTWGARFLDGLPMASPAVHIYKGTGMEDGYSAFSMRDPRAAVTLDTGLARMLTRLDVRNVVVCGLTTDYCVKQTVLDALRMGFGVTVVVDAIRAVNVRPGDGNRAVAEMVAAGADITTALAPERHWPEVIDGGLGQHA